MKLSNIFNKSKLKNNVSGDGTTVVTNKKRVISTIICIVLAIILISSVLTIIPAGHTGVISVFGQVSSDVMQEGLNFKLPWQHVTKVDNRIVKLEVSTQAFSKDLQTVDTTLAVNYRLDTSMSYYIYKNIGTKYEDVMITPAVNEVLKAIVAKYTAEQSITNRSAISNALYEDLNKKLNSNGLYVTEVNIIDFDFSDTYISAVEAKQVAEQDAQKAKIEQTRLTMEKEAEAERQIIAANAALEVSKIEAEAVEYAGQKEAAANKAISSTLTPTLVEYYKIQQWNGELPQVTGANTFMGIDLNN